MNIWKFIYLNCGERYEFMVDHHSYTHNLSRCEIKAWKIFRSDRDSNRHDLCNTGAVVYRLSYQDSWELVTLWVRNIPVDHEECDTGAMLYRLSYRARLELVTLYTRRLWTMSVNIWKPYIWTVEKNKRTWMIIAMSYTHKLGSCENKSWKKSRLDHEWDFSGFYSQLPKLCYQICQRRGSEALI